MNEIIYEYEQNGKRHMRKESNLFAAMKSAWIDYTGQYTQFVKIEDGVKEYSLLDMIAYCKESKIATMW